LPDTKITVRSEGAKQDEEQQKQELADAAPSGMSSRPRSRVSQRLKAVKP